MFGVIGGSGLSTWEGLVIDRTAEIETPYGKPSAPLTIGRIGEATVAFLPRHGAGHTLAPHRINYRANMWALKQAGVRGVVALATVGGIRSDFGPGTLVIPDQLIDYTWGRESTYFEGDPVKHVDMTQPYDGDLRRRILVAARELGEFAIDGGVYGATQGPRLETAAEIARMEKDGADLVGMTGMPEAALARELELPYATLALVVNHAAGHGDSRESIRMEDLQAVLVAMAGRARKIVQHAVTP